jgi:hypothetical protein
MLVHGPGSLVDVLRAGHHRFKEQGASQPQESHPGDPKE